MVLAACLIAGVVQLVPTEVLPFVEAAAADPAADYRAAVLAESPYAYLPLADTSGTQAADVSGNSRHGTYQGGVTLGASGPFAGEGAASFGGSGQYVSLASALVPATGDWTVEAWVLPQGGGFGDGDPVWSQYFTTSSRRTAGQLAGCGGPPRCVHAQIGSATGQTAPMVSESSWHHLAWRRNGNTVSVLLDGMLVNSFSATGQVDSKSTWIGGMARSGWATAYFQGRIAHFSVVRSALSDARIGEHFDASGHEAPGSAETEAYAAAVMADAPYTYTPLDELVGTTANDDSGNGRNATYEGPVGLGGTGPFGSPGSMTIDDDDEFASFDEALVPPSGDWTVETWARPIGTGYGNGDPIWSQYHDDFSRRTMSQFSHDCEGTGTMCAGAQIGATITPTTGEVGEDDWYQVVVRRTGNVLEVFLDTELVARTTTSTAVDTKDTWIGGLDGSSAEAYFGGQLAHFSVYRSSLSSGRILAHYLASGREPPSEQTGNLCCDEEVEDPVSTAHGNFLHTETDVAMADEGSALSVERTYSSRDPRTGIFGPGWSSSLSPSLVETPGGELVLREASGRQAVFRRTGSPGVWVRPDGIAADPVDLGTDTWGLEWDDGRAWEFVDTASSGRVVAEYGPLDAGSGLSARSPVTELTYDVGGRLQVVESLTSGRDLSLTYDLTHTDQVASIVADDGRTVAYEYDGGGHLVSAAHTVTVPGGSPSIETWTYEVTNGLITRIEDPDGRMVVENTYIGSDPGGEGYGKVEQQELANGNVVSYSYSVDVDAPSGPTSTTAIIDAASGDELSYVHDAATGRVIETVDPFSNTVTRSYAGNGHLASVTDRRANGAEQTFDANGNVLTRTELDENADPVAEHTYVYDGQNRVTSSTVTDPATSQSFTTEYGYDGTERSPSLITAPDQVGETTPASTIVDVNDTTGLVDSVTDPDGVLTEYAYNPDQTLASTTVDPGGLDLTTTYGYDGAGNQTSVTSPEGLVTTSVYDSRGRLRSATEPGEAPTLYEYDASGNVTSVTDPTGAESISEFDPVTGDLISSADPDGDETTFHYDAAGDMDYEVAPGGVRTDHVYGELARLTSSTLDAGGLDRTTTYGYDEDGNQTTATVDPGGLDLLTTTGYDALGRSASSDNGVDPATITAYDARGLVISSTDGNGIVTTYEYDEAGRQVRTRVDGATTETRGYSPAGRLAWVDAWVSEGTQHRTSYGYDDAGRQVTVTEAESGVTTTVLDDDGRSESVTSPAGIETTYTSVSAMNVTTETVTHPASGSTTRVLSARGELLEETTPAGTTTYTYEPDGDLESVTDPEGGVVTYGYDGRGNRTSRTSAEGVEGWGVNAADEQVLAEDFASRDTVTVYDQAGRVDTVTDPTGRVEDRAYDAAGRVVEVEWTDGVDTQTVTYDYDDGGRLASRVDAGFASGIDGTTTYGYDVFGNMASVAGPGLDLAFTWDRAGNRLTSTQDGVTTTYGYDGNGRLESVANGWLGSVSYARNADGVVEEETLGSGQWRQWTLDPVSGLPEAFDQRIDGVDTATDLTWDAAGRLASETTGGVVTDYGYDAAGQLTSVVRDGAGGGDDEVFTYDDLGRRLTQVDGAGTTSFAYDSGTGELASMTHPVDGVTTYDYDAAGRRVTEANSTTGATTSYVYDPAGRLSEVDHDTSTDDWTETHLSNGDGLLSRLTVTDPVSGPDEVVDLTWDPTMGIPQVAAVDRGSGDWDHLAYGQGRLASLRPDTTTAWFATDHLGSATATPDTAALTAAESYGAWGENRTGPTADLGLTFGYRGEATTGDHIYLRARTYQPGTGQFLTRDPLDGVDGTTTVANPWHYTNNDAMNRIDPSGLRTTDGCRSVVGQAAASGNWVRGRFEGAGCHIEPRRVGVGADCGTLFGPGGRNPAMGSNSDDYSVSCSMIGGQATHGSTYQYSSGCVQTGVGFSWTSPQCGPQQCPDARVDCTLEWTYPNTIHPGVFPNLPIGAHELSCGTYEPHLQGMCQQQPVNSFAQSIGVAYGQICIIVCVSVGTYGTQPFVTFGPLGTPGFSLNVGSSSGGPCDRAGGGSAVGAAYWLGGWAEAGDGGGAVGGGGTLATSPGASFGRTYTLVGGC